MDQLKGKYVVVKLSGKALDKPSWARDIAELQALGAMPVVVHGGGKQIDALSAKLGLTPSFHDGLRVTDAPTLEVAEMVLAREGKRIAAQLLQQGVNALGLSGRDAGILHAVPRSKQLGHVGRITAVDHLLLELLCSDGFVPVLNSIATGPDGTALNTNADEAAQAIAVALGAQALLLLSDVDGVLGPAGRIAHATPASIAELRASGVASGGMLPKLEACSEAVEHGVGMVRIARSDAPILQALDRSMDLGTLVTPEA
ncbi:MAG: acetylglutamate kinase [Halobacteriales archaeon]|nr:acetylglutamate kinase [Halobacteriales archaeon]